MLDETEQTSPTTSAVRDHRPRRRPRRLRCIGASLSASEAPGKGNVAGAEQAAKEAPYAGRPTDHPLLAALVANPDRVVDVPVNRIAALLASLASEQARLVTIQGVLMTRLLESQSAVKDESVDHLLTAEEVAEALGVTRRWVQRRAVAYRSRGASRSTPFATPNWA